MGGSGDAPDAHSAHDSVLNPAENILDLPSAKVSIEEREGHLAVQGTIRPPKPRGRLFVRSKYADGLCCDARQADAPVFDIVECPQACPSAARHLCCPVSSPVALPAHRWSPAPDGSPAPSRGLIEAGEPTMTPAQLARVTAYAAALGLTRAQAVAATLGLTRAQAVARLLDLGLITLKMERSQVKKLRAQGGRTAERDPEGEEPARHRERCSRHDDASRHPRTNRPPLAIPRPIPRG